MVRPSMRTTGSTIWLAEVMKASRARIGFLERESALLDGEALRLDGVERNGAGDAAQDGVIGMPGDQRAGRRDDPGIGRGGFGDDAVLVDEPGVARALLDRRLPRQHVGQKPDRLDVDAAPAVVRHADDGDALFGERLVARPIERARRHDQARRACRGGGKA